MKYWIQFLLLVVLAGCSRGRYLDLDPGAMKSLPGDFSFHALYTGDGFREYRFFEHAERHPLKPTVTAFDADNAWWCAEAALLAYVPDEGLVREKLGEAGFKDVFYYWRPGALLGPDPQWLIAVRDDLVIVSFRGSEPNVADWFTNARVMMTPFGGGRVHSGFLDTLNLAAKNGLGERIEKAIAERPDRPVWFTGHSQGGALATLAAARWFALHPGLKGCVYTFGEPRIGDEAFRESVHFPMWRMVHACDAITKLPPEWVYRHSGQLEWIGFDGRLRENEPQINTFGYNARFWIDEMREGKWVWLPRNVIDHSPLYYAIWLYNGD